jgi:hypothetical protein
MVLVDLPIGEALDRLSILQIQSQKLSSQEAIKQINDLGEIIQHSKSYPYFFKLLSYYNNNIWDLTNEINSIIHSNDKFHIITAQIVELNCKRQRLINYFNLWNGYQKTYTYISQSHCKIIIDSENLIYSKIEEINYLCLEYDIVEFNTTYTELLKNLLVHPNIQYNNNNTNDDNDNIKIINLNDYQLSENLKKVYELPSITYAAGGLFGDLIQQLSVINEKYLKTAKKGILYITNDLGEPFRHGLDNTYTDLYDIIISQPYIKDFKILKNEICDINLSSWRQSPLLRRTNWYNIFSAEYSINWGTHKWLNLPIDPKWADKILINTTSYRFPINLDFNLIYQKYQGSLVFISSNPGEYNCFTTYTGVNIQYYCPTSFKDLCIAINSCKIFIGSLSAPLSVAHATHKDRIIGLCTEPNDNVHNVDLNSIWNNIKYSISTDSSF